MIYDTLNQAYSEFYNPLENLSVDSDIKFKGKVILRQYIPKERYGIKIHKLCDDSEYTYITRVYFGKDAQTATGTMKATHSTVRNLTQKAEGIGHKVFVDNSFFLAHTS
jgi:hypothetical protein